MLDLSLPGSAIAQNYKLGDRLERLGIAGGRVSASGSAELRIDFGRFGNYRIATPVDIELRLRLTPPGSHLSRSAEPELDSSGRSEATR